MRSVVSPMDPKNDAIGEVFDIQPYSVHDGPGCRTLVFLSGCPLRCAWCANPEGFEIKGRTLFRESRCVRPSQGCTRCIAACPARAISLESGEKAAIHIDWEKCKVCESLACVDACLSEAFVLASKRYKVSELMRIFSRDRHYWAGSGGVTFSGGDPLMQKDFLLAALKACRGAYIHTAIETSGFFPEQTYLEVMAYTDFAFQDIKHMDSALHREKTGVPNELILSNIVALSKSNWQGRMVLRAPVIEGFNDTEENMRAIADFMRDVGLTEFNLLPFHRLGDAKWKSCGKIYPYHAFKATPAAAMRSLQKVLTDQGIRAYIGAETPF